MCTQHILKLQFSYTELVIQLTICRQIVGYVVDVKIRASDKDLPVQNALQNGLIMVKIVVRNVVQNAENMS